MQNNLTEKDMQNNLTEKKVTVQVSSVSITEREKKRENYCLVGL